MFWGHRYHPKYRSVNASQESKVWENGLMNGKEILDTKNDAVFWSSVIVCPEVGQNRT